MAVREPYLKNASYETFILLLSLLSLSNLAFVLLPSREEIDEIIKIVDYGLSIVFLLDFAYRFHSAHSRSKYLLLEYGWLDFIGSLPMPFLRIGRIYRVVWVARRLRPLRRRVFRRMLRERAETALLGVLFLTIVLLEVASALVLSIETQTAAGNIRTASDALWWTWVSVTTVGYGDRYPVTDAGRLVGVVTLAVGVGLFGTLTGYLANAFLRPNARFEREARNREELFRAEIANIRHQLGIVDKVADPFAADTAAAAANAADPVGR